MLKRRMDDSTKESLKKLWEDNAYPSATPLYKIAQRRGLRVKVKDVESCLKDRASTSLLQQRKEPYAVGGSFDTATRQLERVYLDLWDRSTHPSPDGYNYLMIAIDSFTRKAWAVPLKKETTRCFHGCLPCDREAAGRETDSTFCGQRGRITRAELRVPVTLGRGKTVLKRKQGRNGSSPH